MEYRPSFIYSFNDDVNHTNKKLITEVLKIENVIIAYNTKKDNIYYYDDVILTLINYIDIVNISIFTITDNKIDNDPKDIYTKIKTYINNTCFNDFNELQTDCQLNSSVIFNTFVIKKVLSKFLPYIPLLKINIINELNSRFIFYKDKIAGYLIDSTTIVPLNFTLTVITSFIKNNGLYILPNLMPYKTCTVNNSDREENYMIIKEQYKINNNSYLNKDDIIYELNNLKFNKIGLVFIKELGMYLHVNTYFMIIENSEIEIKYTPKRSVKETKTYSFPVKTIKYNIKLFNDELLRIPIKLQPVIELNNLKITVLSYELLQKYPSEKHPFDINQFENSYSQDKYIVILNVNEINNKLDDKLYILTKISGKEINNYDSFIDIISKIKNKNKRKISIINNYLPEEQTIYV